jgi:hypothetical protein
MTDNRQAPWGVRLPADLQDKFLARIEAEKITKSQGMIAAIETWLGIDQGITSDTDTSTENRFQAIEEQMRALTEQVQGIDRSPKTKIKAAKPATDDQDGLTFSQFNSIHGTTLKRGDKAAKVNQELVKLGLHDEFFFKSSVNKIYKIAGAD